MTVKSKAGVLALAKAFKTSKGQLVEIPLGDLQLSSKAKSKTLSYALAMVRQQHIRLNEWDTIELDIVEDRLNSLIVDVNFLTGGFATHRVLSIKVIGDNPVGFESVSVHALKK